MVGNWGKKIGENHDGRFVMVSRRRRPIPLYSFLFFVFAVTEPEFEECVAQCCCCCMLQAQGLKTYNLHRRRWGPEVVKEGVSVTKKRWGISLLVRSMKTPQHGGIHNLTKEGCDCGDAERSEEGATVSIKEWWKITSVLRFHHTRIVSWVMSHRRVGA